MLEAGQPFDVALAVTRVGNLFTTHTAVAASSGRVDSATNRRSREFRPSLPRAGVIENQYRRENVDDCFVQLLPPIRLDATALIYNTINSDQFSEA
jgi:hypothetical protein